MNTSPPSPSSARYAEQAFLLALGGGILGAAAAIFWLGPLGLLLAILALAAAQYFYKERFQAASTALGPFMALLGIILFFTAAYTAVEWYASDLSTSEFWRRHDNRFWSSHNARTILTQGSITGVAALGMTLIIVSGGIDLSAGAAVALAATVLAWVMREKDNPQLALQAAIATGVLAGIVNGTLIGRLRVAPFIVTLGTMTIYLGVAKLIAGETTVRPPSETVPEWVVYLLRPTPNPEWLLLPTGVWVLLILALLLTLTMRYTVFGRYVFAIGSNESTARLCGIRVDGMKVLIYALAGLFVGVAGIYQFARLSVGNPTSGMGLELKIIAAVVIGGGSLSGGRGSALGTLAGAGIMAVIANGCTMLGLSNPTQDIVIGVIIVAAVTIDQFRQRRLAA